MNPVRKLSLSVMPNVTLIPLVCLLLFGSGVAFGEVIFTTDTYIGPGNTTYDNEDIIVDGCVLTVDGAHPFNSLQVINDGTVTHSANADTQEFTLDLTIATDVTVEAGSVIDVDGKGYSSSNGPGQGSDHDQYGAGAGYGGEGGGSTGAAGGAAYGSILQPIDIGSGGGRGAPYDIGGPGGGAVRLDVAGTLTIEGDITANGADGGITGSNYGGGGSGGSIYVTAGILTGGGTVSAAGGDAALVTGSGGGGGGRIALYADDFGGFGWSTPAHGGDGYVPGGAGTAYFKETAAASGILVVDNNTVVGAWTPLTSPEAFDLAIRHAAIAYPTEAMTVGDLMINDDSRLTHASGGPGIDLTVQGDATIDPNAAIDVSGRGYGSSSGPGEGGDHSQYAAGAGYGGTGANSTGATGGSVYGSITEPTDLGSGGGRTDTFQQGGPGGGAVHLNIAGILTIDGAIIADGANGTLVGSNQGGGGSGGSVYFQAAAIAGSGGVSADGGDSAGTASGGGGGGRIAIYHDDNYAFSGTITAYGGGATRFGGAGTIYLRSTAELAGDLFVHNNSNSGAWTDLPATYPSFRTVQVEAAGVLAVPAEATLTTDDLHVLADGTLTHRSTGTGGIQLDVANDATIALDGKIHVNGRGFGSRSGPGAGGDGPNNGCGAGHAGGGGRSNDSTARGVTSDGAFEQPDTLGSGGGGDSDGQNASGGAGGGAVQLTVGGNLVVEGQILADGAVGTIVGSEAGGGGSGGSVWITANDLAGAGSISANGADGASQYAGGGGGGHVAVYSATDTFTGTITACGGAGYEVGGAGTVYIESGGALGYALIIDNCTTAGYRTELPGVLQIDNNLIVRNAAQLTHLGELTVDGDFTVETEGSINHHTANEDGLHLIVTGDAGVDATSNIDVSTRGFAPRTGPGAGGSSSASGAGAGYGGPGGNGSNTTGGSTYGSFTEPTDLGSGGGEETDAGGSGGYGGGVLRLSVSGTLAVEGGLLANGGNGTSTTNQDNGGGSGGSLWISAGTLVGTGPISANGGNGGGGVSGGGGGGGRIALYTTTNAFTGPMTACGGTGYVNGGAGTIYVDSVDGVGNALVLDNCGVSGAETDLAGAAAVGNNVIVRNHATLTHTGDLTIDGNLSVESTGLVTQPQEQGASHFTVTGDTTIDVGGRISVSERGHAPRSGPGAGGSTNASGAGGGYGGPGGNGSDTTGGAVYGSITGPIDLGSGGGEETDQPNGGRGGGAVRLSVTGTLTVEGELFANGGNGGGATNHDNGGGSGGSLWLTTGILTGSGTISAIGGNGGTGVLGGGGGGGRIAVYCDDTAGYSGTILAHAGTGYESGGAGTIYTKTSAQTYGDVLYDNGGISGAWTPFTETDPFAYTIANGAIVYPTEPLGVRSIHIAGGGLLTHPDEDTNFVLEVEEDVTIDSGGAIAANGRGYSSSSGPGQGGDGVTYGAGAGYGGAGGNSSQADAGNVYGYEEKPDDFGSGGGNGQPHTNGGHGGGVIHMSIAGTLQVDGELAVNGGAGWNVSSNYGGGGSGGSLSLHVGTLDGAGLISTNGGAGAHANSGGGGGGRIAIFSCDVLMPLEQFTATGGAGWENGEDGTIFFGSGTVEILQQPQGGIAFVGDSFVFEVVATGNGPLSYQWRQDGVNLVDDGRITGALTDTLSIDPLVLTDMGDYDVLVTDDCGAFPSDSARLIVPPPGDMNCNGVLDAFDIDPFVLALTDPAGYAAAWPDCDIMLADIDGDGDVDAFDIDPFVELLTGG